MGYREIFNDISNKKFKKLYLFCGEEEFVKEEALNRMIDTMLRPDFRDLNYVVMDGNDISIDDIINACETLPFMDEKRLLVVKDLPLFYAGKGQQSDMEKLKKYTADIPDTSCLVFYMRGDVDKRKAVYRAVKKMGKVISFDRLKDYEIETWVQGRLKKQRKSMSADDIRYFVYLVGTNLQDVDNELNKLISYADNDTVIKRPVIDKLVTRALDNTIFQLVDEIGKKSASGALVLLDELLYQGQSIFAILGMIVRQFRLISQAKGYSRQGYSKRIIAQKMGTPEFVADKCIQQARNFTLQELEQALKDCLELDYSIKSGNMLDRLGLELLIINMCITKKAS